ncbi:MAG: amidohydrolase family protein [Promethearchaeota archaeon]
MLEVKIETEQGSFTKNILVIDGHSHLGRDVDGAEMMNPLTPGTGTFDFWANVQSKVAEEWAKAGDQQFAVVRDGKAEHYEFNFKPLKFWWVVSEHLGRISSGEHSNLLNKTRATELIDHGVVFPFQDVFRDKKPEALYWSSNLNVSRFTTRFPFSMRLSGYCRVDPMEGERAVKAVEYAATRLGIRGLKLHPRSEGWIDHINSPQAVEVLVEAAKHSLPVIFDTRGRGSILDIAELIANARNTIQNRAPQLLPHLKVQIGHCAQGNVGDEAVYRAVVAPNTWGELSMLHGQGAANFFEDFRKWYASTGLEQQTGKKWSEYLIYGSDYPYFGDMHAAKLIHPIISKRFFETGGTIEDAENILGLNLLKIFPEYCRPVVETTQVPNASAFISQPSPDESSMDVALRTIARLVESNKIDIKRLVYQYASTWRNFKDEYLLIAQSKVKNQEVKLVLMNFVKERLTLISTVGQNSTWKPFGYKYFNPEDRNFFQYGFANSQPANDDETAANSLGQVI